MAPETAAFALAFELPPDAVGRLRWLYARIDSIINVQDAAHAGRAIISVDEPMRLFRGLHTDSDLELIANGLFQPFDNGLQPNQSPSHLFIADTNHFALPLLLAAQAREGNEARDNAVLMQTHQVPHGGTFVLSICFFFVCTPSVVCLSVGKQLVQDAKTIVTTILARINKFNFTHTIADLSKLDTLYPAALLYALRAHETTAASLNTLGHTTQGDHLVSLSVSKIYRTYEYFLMTGPAHNDLTA